MSNILNGVIAGTILGIVSLVPMYFIKIDHKRRAMISSFINRFAIGFVIFNMELGISELIKGGLVGLIMSLPAAILSGKYVPILVPGIVGGIISGLFV